MKRTVSFNHDGQRGSRFWERRDHCPRQLYGKRPSLRSVKSGKEAKGDEEKNEQVNDDVGKSNRFPAGRNFNVCFEPHDFELKTVSASIGASWIKASLIFRNRSVVSFENS